jgi:GntR family transcriptional regulator, carbon starvation induced regulator
MVRHSSRATESAGESTSKRAERTDRNRFDAPRTPARGRVAARLLRRILADIVHGRLKPGTRLNLLSLAAEYGASTNAVREALIQLTGSGLIVRQAAQGFHVAPATQSDFLELVKTLCWIEETGIRESISNGDQLWEERVLIAHRALAQLIAPAAREIDGDLLDEQRLAYHEALISACHSSILIEHCRTLQQRLSRYRNLAAVGGGEDDPLDGLLATRDPVLARDLDHAVRLLRTHYRLTASSILASGALL